MLFLVLTYCEKFWSLIKGRVFRVEKDMVFFKDTEPADVACGIPWGSFHQDLPFQCVSYSLSWQLVDVLGEAGPRIFRVPDIWVMPSPSALHGLGSGACIGLHLACVSPGDWWPNCSSCVGGPVLHHLKARQGQEHWGQVSSGSVPKGYLSSQPWYDVIQ